MAKRLNLNPIEQRYIATCYPLPDRPGIEYVEEWKERMRQSSLEGKAVEIPVDRICAPFPHVGSLCEKGFFETTGVQEYFEGLGEGSHNMRMYQFAKRVARNRLPDEILKGVLEHVDGCSVKPARMSDSTVWSFSGPRKARIDRDYFGHQECEYGLLHGKNRGMLVLIRGITQEEFEKYRSWFEDRAKSKTSPFVGR